MKFKDQLRVLRLPLIVVTYTILLFFIAINFDNCLTIVNKFIGLMSPFFYGVGIAFVLNIPMKKCESLIAKYVPESSFIYKKKRAIGIVFAIMITFMFIGFFGSIILPQLFETIANLVSNLVVYINSLFNNIDEIFQFLHLDPINVSVNSDIINQILNNLGLNWNDLSATVNRILSSLGSAGFSAIDFISRFTLELGYWFMGIMISIYLLSSKEKFIRQAKMLVATIFSYETSLDILFVTSRANSIFNSFISGQLVEALIIGGLIYVALLLFNMPFAILIASLASVMALVPVFGPTLACVIGFILVLSTDPLKAIFFVIIYQVVQQLENTIIYPKVVGKSVGLPAIWTLLSIVVFGGLYGVLGMLLAVPLTACIYSFGTDLVHRTLKRKRIVFEDDTIKCNK